MEVYRVEHPASGYGPFRDGAYRYHETEIPYQNPSLYPSLFEDECGKDIDPYERHEWYTGVLALNKIDYWFPPLSDFRKYLKENGYKLTTYDVHPDNVRHGRSNLQLVFARGKATKLKEEEL